MSTFQLIQTDAATAVGSRAPTKPVVLGGIDKTLNAAFAVVVPAQHHKVYRLVEAQTQQLVKGQRLVRKGNNLLVEVDGATVVNLTGFFNTDATPGSTEPSATPSETKPAPGAPASTGAQYVFDAELADGSYGLIDATSQGTAIADGSSLMWASGQTPAGVVNPAMLQKPTPTKAAKCRPWSTAPTKASLSSRYRTIPSPKTPPLGQAKWWAN